MYIELGSHLQDDSAIAAVAPVQPMLSPEQPLSRLPPEIAFLDESLISSAALDAAILSARLSNVSADVALIADGHLSADAFYKNLARYIGVPYLPAYWPLAHGLEPQLVIASGIAPLAPNPGGFGYVIAPRGPALLELLSHFQHTQNPGREFVITSPGQLTRLVLVSGRQTLANHASMALSQSAPHFSARAGASQSQWLAACLCAILLAAGLLLAPRLAITIGSSFLAFIFLSSIVIRLEAVFMHTRKRDKECAAARDDHTLPVYTIIAPLYREARVLRPLVAALSRLDYPAAKLDIKLVVEADDATTISGLARMHLPANIEVLVAPPGAPRTKPRALNVALPFARGDYIVVYDAEDDPDPDQLRKAAAHFAQADAGLVCLQAHLAIDNCEDTWLTRLFAIEYAALFDVINPGYANLGLPFPLGGTSNHFRTDALRAVCGWDAWNVTEDADLGIRLARSGLRIGTFNSTTREEAPAHLRSWCGQRQRWFKGWIQTLITHTRQPADVMRQLGLARAIAVFALLLATLLGALLGPSLFALTLHQAVFGDLLSPDTLTDFAISGIAVCLCASGFVSALLPAILGLRRRKKAKLIPWLALLPVYYLLMSYSAWTALIDLWRRPFFWIKTEHGLAKTSSSRGQLKRR